MLGKKKKIEPDENWESRKNKENKRKGIYGLSVGEFEIDFGY